MTKIQVTQLLDALARNAKVHDVQALGEPAVAVRGVAPTALGGHTYSFFVQPAGDHDGFHFIVPNVWNIGRCEDEVAAWFQAGKLGTGTQCKVLVDDDGDVCLVMDVWLRSGMDLESALDRCAEILSFDIASVWMQTALFSASQSGGE